MASNMKIKKKSSEKTFDIINGAFLLILVILVAYPLYYVLIASISDPYEVYAGKTFLLPSKITFEGYKRVFKENSIAGGYLNSIYYTVLGTVVSVALVLTTGYCMSKKTLPFRRAIMIFYVITMYVGGGLIPTYLVVSKMHMLNSVWALILPGGVSVYNVIVTRTFFETSIPQELYEAASIDGANRFKQILHITVPALLPTVVLMTALNLGNILNAGFDQVFNLYSPLVYSTGDILDTWVYRMGLLNVQFSLATAAGLFKSVISFTLIVISYIVAYKAADYKIF